MASCVKLIDVITNEEFTDKNDQQRVRHVLKYAGADGKPKQAMIFENNPLFNRVNELGSKLAVGVEVDLGWSKEPNPAGFRDLVQIEKKGTLAADYAKKWDGKGKSNYGQATPYLLAKDLSMSVSGLMQALIESGTTLDKLEAATITAYGIKKKIEAQVGDKTTPTVPAVTKPTPTTVPKVQRYEAADDADMSDTPW